MTATDQPTPRVGDTIDSTPGLDMLPTGSVVRDRDGDTLRREEWGDWTDTDGNTASAEYLLREAGPVTVVSLRPDAPHPAPVHGDAVEREAWRMYPGAGDPGVSMKRTAFREGADFAAARAGEDMVTRAEAERMVARQREDDLAMHEAYRPEVVAEVAVHLCEEADWEAVAEWCSGTIATGQEPSGEYVSELHIPGVGTAWQGAWIVQRHDLSFDIRAEVAGPSEESVTALPAQRGGEAEWRQRSTHDVHRGPESTPCYCWADGPHQVGQEVHSQRGGEAVDREARERMAWLHGIEAVAPRRQGVGQIIAGDSIRCGTCGWMGTEEYARHLLAARGDVAPSVSAEQVRSLTQALRDQVAEESVGGSFSTTIRIWLRNNGIEVRDV